MPQAINRIYRALLSGEKIAVYGDFDADGITATAVMVKGLTSLGGHVSTYIPHRVSEGHGLKTAALDKLRQQGISLVITVDCGVTAISEVKKATKTGDTYTINLSDINIQKILGRGDITKKINVTVNNASKRAIEKIEAAGGKVVTISEAS